MLVPRRPDIVEVIDLDERRAGATDDRDRRASRARCATSPTATSSTSRRSAMWCRNCTCTSSRGSATTPHGRSRCGAWRRRAPTSARKLAQLRAQPLRKKIWLDVDVGRRDRVALDHGRRCPMRGSRALAGVPCMPPRPDLGPKPLLGYTASILARVAERRSDAALPRRLRGRRRAPAFAIGGELVVMQERRANGADPLFRPDEARALAPTGRNRVPRPCRRGRPLRHRARSRSHRRR